MEDTMLNDDAHVPTPPAHAEPPRSINHMVLNVRNLEVSHRFWTEIIGFRCVAELKPVPERRRPKMRFYSGVDAQSAEPERWDLMPGRVGLNHVAIAWPDRESWLRQLAFLRSKGVPFHRRVNHGMTHSVYISDPDGHGIEVLYELPREVWEKDIDAAQNYSEQLPTEGEAALVDRTDYPVFKGTPRPAP